MKKAADVFVLWANTTLSKEDFDLELEEMLPEKRRRKIKMMAGEKASDKSFTNANSAYETQVHNQAMDTVTESIHMRFLTHRSLYADLGLLDPRNFTEVSSTGLPDTAFQEMSKCLLRFDSRATPANLQSELKCLAAQWPRLNLFFRSTKSG